ncbi:hypothetical protein [Paraburkholderia piptadeniae]|uniref:hypothetical protein n=1 Tax=Paraburkholderia piptadeniae TaxID=1701573 RepID=UPI00117D0233|nr:hypothetical protein [Paraburkholderia piptadeniae]
MSPLDMDSAHHLVGLSFCPFFSDQLSGCRLLRAWLFSLSQRRDRVTSGGQTIQQRILAEEMNCTDCDQDQFFAMKLAKAF